MSLAGTPVKASARSGVKFASTLAQLVETVGPAFDELLVVKPFFDHHMDHGQADGGVSAGLRSQP